MIPEGPAAENLATTVHGDHGLDSECNLTAGTVEVLRVAPVPARWREIQFAAHLLGPGRGYVCACATLPFVMPLPSGK